MAGGKENAELFERYEQEYRTISLAIASKINSSIPRQSGEQRKITINATEREIEEAGEILSHMELELGQLSKSIKNSLSSRLHASKTDLAKLKHDLKKVLQRSGERDALIGSRVASSDLDAAQLDQRQRLLHGTDRLQESTRRLEEGHRLALETEALGASILGDLRAQREQIQHTRDTLHEADSYVDKAQRTLRSMSRRMATNRLITAAIILVLIALIVLVLYSKLF